MCSMRRWVRPCICSREGTGACKEYAMHGRLAGRAGCSLCQIHRTRVSSHSSKATCLYNRKPALVCEAGATADVQRHQARICIAAAAGQAAACGAAAVAGGPAQAAAALLGQQVQRRIAQQGAAAQAQRPGGGNGVAWSVGRAEHTGKDPRGSNDHPPATPSAGRAASCSMQCHWTQCPPTFFTCHCTCLWAPGPGLT